MRAAHIDTARLLVERGAQVNAVSHSQHNVFTVLNPEDPNLRARIRLFVRAGGTLDMMRMRGPLRLRHAAVYGLATATLWLLACGVDPDSADQHGHTLLYSCRSLEIVSLLVAAGADQRDLAQSPVFSVENVTEIDTREASRQLGQMRFELIQMRALEIVVALQNLRLPALLTTMIVDEAVELAPLIPMHLKWKLVTLVKHWKQ
jgi:ankyrin repeat protein